MKLLYFAWVRERTGVGEEEVPLPEGVVNVSDLVGWLKTRGAGFEEAFSDKALVRVAVNQEYATLDAEINEGDEVAFFPPVTGGRS